jgi:hypothetical protein
MTSPNPLFSSFFLGGFECSTHRRPDGQRLDLIDATLHDAFVLQDYQALRRHGIRAIRDGVRWHLVERVPGCYDWSSFLPMLAAARETGMQPIWDLCHYGWPDDLDVWSPAFVERFARFAAAVAGLVRDECPGTAFYCPINEISFWAWAGGDMALFNPTETGRGMALKKQLVRASLAAVRAIREVDPSARIAHIDPVIHVVPGSPEEHRAAAHLRNSQYEAWDMLGGRAYQELGGDPAFLDLIGVNYYSDNQWRVPGGTIGRDDPQYRPFREILAENWRRYQRPLFVAETGAEGQHRVPWLRYVCDEVHAAIEAGVPVEGICFYPITDYPGWADERHCETGLFGLPDAQGRREANPALAEELLAQQARFDALLRAAPPRSGLADR